MDPEPSNVSRRALLAGAGATASVTAIALGGAPTASAAQSTARGGDVTATLNGRAATLGAHSFPGAVDTLVLDNGLVRYTFGRDDAAGGSVTGWADVSITATSVIVDGTELASGLNGVEPRDPDRQHSFYVDAAGGKSRLVCSEVVVLRCTPDLVEVAFRDTTSTPLRHEHHLVMRRGKRGLYGYVVTTALADTTINEIRMNTRWDRRVFDHAFTWERGSGQQPTYAYLATQTPVQDETWRVDGVNRPDLPSPGSNSGNLPAGDVYSKYEWGLYHHENPMFGHHGNGFGTWLTPLGGVSDDTLCASYGVGPNHQDLAVHQDALILNYFGANHYGLPAYPLRAGYRRLYGPWYSFLTTADPADADAVVQEAARVARQEIAEHRCGAAWVEDPLYPTPAQRSTVSGRLRLSDGRPAGNFWILLSTQDVADVYTIHEPTYFVRTDAEGRFTLPGIPPAWQPGTTEPGTYVLYAFAAGGSVVEQFTHRGVTVTGASTDLGTLEFTPTRRSTFLWQIGGADRKGGEFALAADPATQANPRSYEKPARVPGDLAFVVGSSWEPRDWYYAQTQAGTWRVRFPLDRVPTGTAYLTVASSLQSGAAPQVAVNGASAGISGTLPATNDSTIARQADRSGYPRTAVLSFPASMLVAGQNEVTFTRGAGTPAGDGLGWDTVLLEVDEAAAPAAGGLDVDVVASGTRAGVSTWRVRVRNRGRGAVRDVRLAAVTRAQRWRQDPVAVAGRDPQVFPVPVAAVLPAGGEVVVVVSTAGKDPGGHRGVTFSVSADGGRTRSAATS